jgi:hypothetical protein
MYLIDEGTTTLVQRAQALTQALEAIEKAE